MLKLAGDGVIAEHIETLQYVPGLRDSGDMESAARTITATGEATGTANADYNTALTLPAPSDSRLSVLRIAARLAVTIDSMTAATLYCRVYVDAQDLSHRLFDLSWTTTGGKLAVVDTHSGNLPIIFNLLKDGAAHTFYFFFWVDAGNAVISLCQLWEGVGVTDGNAGWGHVFLCLSHSGTIQISFEFYGVGSGVSRLFIMRTGVDGDTMYSKVLWAGSSSDRHTLLNDPAPIILSDREIGLRLCEASVATDLAYMAAFAVTLRSEQ